MKLTFTKLATIGAVVLTLATFNAQEASAQCAVTQAVTWDAQYPETFNICATIDNKFETLVTDIDFQTIGATNATGEAGCLILDAATGGTIDESNSTCNGPVAAPVMARLVSDDEAGEPGAIVIEGAFPNQEVRLAFDVTDRVIACTDDAGLGSGTSADLVIQRLFTDQTTTAAEWVYDGTDVATSTAAATVGEADTDASGDLTIYIGAEIQTDGTGDPYHSGACEGSFDVTLFY